MEGTKGQSALMRSCGGVQLSWLLAPSDYAGDSGTVLMIKG
jgi:hypothetical protein